MSLALLTFLAGFYNPILGPLFDFSVTKAQNVSAARPTLDSEGFPSIRHTVAEYQRILSIQEVRRLAFDCALKQLGLCRLWPKNLRASGQMKLKCM